MGEQETTQKKDGGFDLGKSPGLEMLVLGITVAGCLFPLEGQVTFCLSIGLLAMIISAAVLERPRTIIIIYTLFFFVVFGDWYNTRQVLDAIAQLPQ